MTAQRVSTRSGSAVEEVRQAADALVAAFGRGDLDAYFACFSADATFLFHSTDALIPSTADYRCEWARWEDEQGYGVLDCTTSDTDVRLHGDTAVLTHRVRTLVTASGATSVLHERETIVFRRQPDGRWLAVHEHLSPAP
ncbi:MAG: YybH family protein [Actinomycetes bacterium]